MLCLNSVRFDNAARPYYDLFTGTSLGGLGELVYKGLNTDDD